MKVKLGDICEINPRTPIETSLERISFIPMQNVGEHGELDASLYITPPEAQKKGYCSFMEGDVLLAKITPCLENGKGALVKNLYGGKGVGSTEFHVLRPKGEIVHRQWLYFYTVSPTFRKACQKNMTGSGGQKRVPKQYLRHYEISLPSLSEQNSQAATLMRLRDQVSDRRAQLLKLDELVKARFVEMFGNPIVNDKQWPIVKLGNIASIHIGPFGSILHKEDYKNGGHALVNPSHICSGKIKVDEAFAVSEEKYHELTPYWLEVDDIVMGRRGEMGRCAVVETKGLVCGTGSLIIRPKGTMKSFILQNILTRPEFKMLIESKAVGVTMPNLNVPIVSSLDVPLLPINGQESYLNFLKRVDKSKVVVQKALDKAQQLYDSLMQQYFD